jgi:hypothetical protein
MSVEEGVAGEILLASRPGQFLFQQQVTEIVTNLIVDQIFRGLGVMFRQASDSSDVAPLSLFGEPEEVHMTDEFLFDWISHDLPP